MIYPQITMEGISQLFAKTYQGSSTQQINQAYSLLIQTAKFHYIPFLNICSKILQKSSHNSRSICQSVSNFIKVFTKIMTNEHQLQDLGPKDFINKIDQIFDNSNIPFEYKQNIGYAYIKAALYFYVNLQTIINRISYLYKTNEQKQAILLSRAYISCDQSLAAKNQNLYYYKILPLELKCISKYILAIRQQNKQIFQKAQQSVFYITEILKNVHLALINVSFQKFQTSIFACLSGNDIIQIIDSINLFKNYTLITIIHREIVQKIIENLFRMRRIDKVPNLVDAIRKLIELQWIQYQQILINQESCLYKDLNVSTEELEDQISRIKLLIEGVNSHWIQILDENFYSLNLVVQLLFAMSFHLFREGVSNLKQTFLLFEDICFKMKSECFQVKLNQLIKAMLTNNEILSSKIFNTFDDYLFKNQNFDKLMQTDWNFVKKLLNLLVFQVFQFISNQNLLQKIQYFIKKYQKILFQTNDIEIYFYSLLILCNYQDDIFCDKFFGTIYQSVSANFVQKRFNAQNQAQSFQQMLVGYFEKKILKDFYSAVYPQNEIVKQSKILFDYLMKIFDEEAMPVFIQCMKNYQILDETILLIMEIMLEDVSRLSQSANINNFHKIQIFVKFFEAFFVLEHYRHLFEATFARILPIFKNLMLNTDLFMNEFFTILKCMIQNIKSVPQMYLDMMSNLYTSLKLQSIQSFNSLIMVLRYLFKNNQKSSIQYQIFVNFLVCHLLEIIVCSTKNTFEADRVTNLTKTTNQLKYQKNIKTKLLQNKSYFSLHQEQKFSHRELLALLSLHQIIYYYAEYLTQNTLLCIVTVIAGKLHVRINQKEQFNREQKVFQQEKSTFQILNGKYQLVFILLFKKRLTLVNQILKSLRVIDQVYDIVYMKDNHYLLDYDSYIFIKQQAEILKNITIDQYQTKYANTSFLAIFYKFFLIYQAKQFQVQRNIDIFDDNQSSDSDYEEFERASQFQSNLKQITKIVRKFPKPDQWININQLKQIKGFVNIVRSNQSGRQWLEILIKNTLDKNQKKLMEHLIKDLENVNGKYRTIKKVNRGICPIQN